MNKMSSAAAKDFPNDVLIDILKRLPVKTLIRLRCVCKSWYAIITHSSFIATHLNCASLYNNNTSYLHYLRFGSFGKQIWCLLSDQPDDDPAELVQLEIPFNSRSKCFIFVGSFNGIVCLSDLYYFGRIIFLWNPSIRQSKTLPCYSSTFPLQLSNPNNSVVLGFGFHSQTNDYKIVRILFFRDENWKYIKDVTPQVEVYSLTMDSWRWIEADVLCFVQFQVPNVFFNGSVHWVASSSVEDADSDMILAFDIGDEVFREMMLPDYDIYGVEMLDLLLSVLNESLSLCVYFQESGACDIWVMREYGVVESWTKQFTIVVPHEGERGVRKSLGFTKNNGLLMETGDRHVVSYDLEAQQLKFLGIRGTGYTSNIVSFMETLVLLDGENALLRLENSFNGVSSEGTHLGKRKSRVACNYKPEGLKEGKTDNSTSRAVVDEKEKQ